MRQSNRHNSAKSKKIARQKSVSKKYCKKNK